MNLKEAINQYYIGAIKQYFNFKGRTGRKAYWMFVLFTTIFGCLAAVVDNIIGTANAGYTIWGIEYGAFYNFYSLVLLLPGLAIFVRRLQDIGKPWKRIFFVFIPIVGWIILIMDLIKEGDPMENEFGPVPAEDPADPNVGGHPYAPNEKPEAGSQKPEGDMSIDIPAIRKEVEEIIAKKKIADKKEKDAKPPKVKWGLDRGAVDFRPPEDRKRKP